MRVLQINSGHLFGGIESLQLTLARERHLCPSLELEYALCFDGKVKTELSQQNVPVHILGPVRIRNPWAVSRVRESLQTLMKERSYDAVICHGSWSLAIFSPVIRKTRIPLVLWLHDPLKGRLDWLSWWAQRTQPDLVICNSWYTARGLHHLYAPARTRHTVIYCAVSPPPPCPSEAERAANRAALQTGPEDCAIIQVSRLDPHKGHLVHLEALGRLRRVPNWVCWQVAAPQRPHEHEYVRLLKDTASRLGIEDRVRFLGWQPDIWKLLWSADLFCQPNSSTEPFGITYVEALSTRLPVVTSAMGGALEIINPSCGILTQAGDVPAVAAALQRLILNPDERRHLGAAGPARASELCAPADRLHELYTNLAALGRRFSSVAV